MCSGHLGEEEVSDVGRCCGVQQPRRAIPRLRLGDASGARLVQSRSCAPTGAGFWLVCFGPTAVDSPKLKRDCRESSASSRGFSGAVLDAPTRVMATSDRHWNSRSRNAGSAISSTDPAESGRPSASRPLVSGSKSGSDSAASPAVSLRSNANNHRAVCQRKLYRPYDSSSAK